MVVSFSFCPRCLDWRTGAILALRVNGGFERTKKFIEAMKVFSFLANVGDSKSLVVHPATVTHGQLTEAEQLLAGVKP
jgi:O-acetylhomoserine (thiol)-lyase